MSVRNGFGDLKKEFELLANGKSSAVRVDLHSIDILHDEEWPALFGMARVEQMRDAGVAQEGQNLTLTNEPAPQVRPVGFQAQDFHRDLMLHLAVGALGEVDDAHSPSSNHL